ncbi:MAG: hypothetical protein Ct9H300mP23_11910 [Nitrospinota bacterium]|nr:MAG: hypothetical protein Ct9H300mP23_11910 [Nitrospinota bacterium]
MLIGETDAHRFPLAMKVRSCLASSRVSPFSVRPGFPETIFWAKAIFGKRKVGENLHSERKVRIELVDQ